MQVAITLTGDQVAAIAERVAQILVDQHADPQQVDPWMNVAHAAEYLACPRGRIHDLVSLGKLSPCRDGRRLLFRRADLDHYILANGGSQR